jgi:hypothetical protein
MLKDRVLVRLLNPRSFSLRVRFGRWFFFALFAHMGNIPPRAGEIFGQAKLYE